MLRREVGLDMVQEEGKDICPTPSPPKPFSAKSLPLARPEAGEYEGYSFWSIPVAIWSGLRSPFHWAGTKWHNLTTRDLGKPTNIKPRSERKHLSQREDDEELKDALSPIFDEMKIHPSWKILEFIPGKSHPIIRAD